MNIVDIVSSTLILISSIIGFFKGILQPFGYIFAFIVSFFIALKNYIPFSNFLVGYIKIDGNLIKLLSFLILLIIIFSLIVLVVLIVVKILKKTPLTIFDKIFGFLFWGLVTFLLIGAILNFFASLNLGESFLKTFKESFVLKCYKIFISSEIIKNVRKY